MKKLISFCIGFLAAVSVSAQDIIVTTAGETIAAKILEVSKTEVRYKEADNLDGPTFVLQVSDLQSITYANGQKEITYETSGSALDTIYYASDFEGAFLPTFSYVKINVPGERNKKWRYVGGNMVFTKDEFVKFLSMYCPEAYEYYRAYVGWLAASWGTMILAFTVVLCFIPITFAAIAGDKYDLMLSTYNTNCAGMAVAEKTPPPAFQDQVHLATINEY